MIKAPLLAMGLLCLAGCGLRELDGSVTIEGEPIKSGSILFLKPAPETAREGAVIRDGKFRIKLAEGNYDVQISSPKNAGKEWVVSMGQKVEVEKRVEMIPEKYNTKSELKFRVDSSTRQIDFQLPRIP